MTVIFIQYFKLEDGLVGSFLQEVWLQKTNLPHVKIEKHKSTWKSGLSMVQNRINADKLIVHYKYSLVE